MIKLRRKPRIVCGDVLFFNVSIVEGGLLCQIEATIKINAQSNSKRMRKLCMWGVRMKVQMQMQMQMRLRVRV